MNLINNIMAKKGQIFNSVLMNLPKRNAFDLSHDRKFTANMGLLYPCLNEEVYPNEYWDIDGTSLVRTAPMVAPMMHQVNIYQHYFSVPFRLLWANWDTFITGGNKFDPEAPIPTPPLVEIPVGGFAVGSIPDYLGFPTGVGAGTLVSAFPFMAYHRVHIEYYRDENLQDTDIVMLSDGDNTALITSLGLFGSPMARCWERDYFTSALPEPQKGPEVTIPLGERAPIRFNDEPNNGRTITRRASDGVAWGDPGEPITNEDVQGRLNSNGGTAIDIDISTTHHVDLSAATSATVNSWRLAVAVQKLYERLARGGSRPIEFLKNVWGSKASSSRLDRPEYLGGAKEPLSVSEVLQTSETNESPQGNMAGHGVAVPKMRNTTYETKEYGIILGMFSVMPKTAYSQGVRKSWLRLTDRFDYYFPDLAHIGEQPVKNAEIYLTSDNATNTDTFGYLPYGTELRYINDSVHGEFRSTQDFWHMGRKFDDVPMLNEEFVAADDVTTRIFADTSAETDKLYCHMYHKIIAKRCIPLFATPS